VIRGIREAAAILGNQAFRTTLLSVTGSTARFFAAFVASTMVVVIWRRPDPWTN
jgi:hypothetical protein